MNGITASRSGGRSGIALLAALSLWLQIVLPAIGTTALVLLRGDHHGPHHAVAHGSGHDDPSPGPPAQGHDHLRLCCIIGGGKLGTGFAPPPVALATLTTPVRPVAIVSHPERPAVGRVGGPVLPVGARAPPRFA
ncbi:hypothetical protein [Microvirga massiliensis]|uniref:hypothetical protein n=1 Tax=Microvirga massiliensis TaxID=1033741 RepID=UPI00062BD67A|nr:hypothetical protein [Microvirga massiliensis]